jgi:hypothetical protein
MLTTELKRLFRKCWKNDKLPSDYGKWIFDAAYLSGYGWATVNGKPIFFD